MLVADNSIFLPLVNKAVNNNEHEDSYQCRLGTSPPTPNVLWWVKPILSRSAITGAPVFSIYNLLTCWNKSVATLGILLGHIWVWHPCHQVVRVKLVCDFKCPIVTRFDQLTMTLGSCVKLDLFLTDMICFMAVSLHSWLRCTSHCIHWRTGFSVNKRSLCLSNGVDLLPPPQATSARLVDLCRAGMNTGYVGLLPGSQVGYCQQQSCSKNQSLCTVGCPG
jgi:hypothetical protein